MPENNAHLQANKNPVLVPVYFLFFCLCRFVFFPPSHAALQHGGPSRGDFISGREVFLICSRPSISATALWPFGELGVRGREVESSTS